MTQWKNNTWTLRSLTLRVLPDSVWLCAKMRKQMLLYEENERRAYEKEEIKQVRERQGERERENHPQVIIPLIPSIWIDQRKHNFLLKLLKIPFQLDVIKKRVIFPVHKMSGERHHLTLVSGNERCSTKCSPAPTRPWETASAGPGNDRQKFHMA